MKLAYLLCFSVASAVGRPVPAEVAGVGNFHQVDQNVYRGGQPTDEGFQNLAKLGIKTIIDLRHGSEHADAERKAAESAGLHYINVPMEGLDPPTDQQISKLITVLESADQAPVFVHCREGKDRTGAVVASYRIAHDHWTNEKALEEAKACGLHSTQHPRTNFILNFVPNVL